MNIKELAEQAGFDFDDYYDSLTQEQLVLFAELVRADEREAIAKMFEAKIWAYEKREIVAAIRAMGEK